MLAFQKNLQKFFIYFFTSISAIVIILGISRAKNTSALGITLASGDTGTTTSDETEAQGSSKTSVEMLTVRGAMVTAQGATYQTPWGSVVTKISVKDGKLTDVEIPELPDSPPSIYAEPYLIDQALRAGGSNIQGVSGATITTNAFKASLESALASARSKGSVVASGTATKNTSSSKKTVSSSAPAYISETPTATTRTATTTARNTTSQAGVSGTFIGDTHQTPWGNASASIVVKNGKITEVTMPQVPNSPPSLQAEPYLVAQALAAGSANIQGVSGATYVSIAFKSSLENAITKAGAQASREGAALITPDPSTTLTSTAQTTKPSVSRKNKKHKEKDEEEEDDD